MTNTAITQNPIIRGTESDDLRAMLTCGHYSGDIFDRSSTWDFTHEAQTCPEGCGQVHFTLQVQTLAARNADDPAVVAAGIVPGPKPATVTLTDEEAALLYVAARHSPLVPFGLLAKLQDAYGRNANAAPPAPVGR